MNTQYFTEVSNQLDKVNTVLTDFQNFMNQALAVQTLSCEQLALYFTQSLGKCSQATTHVAKIGDEVANQVSQMQAAINVEVSALAPLLIAPSNPTGCVTWIGNAVNYFASANVNLGLQLTTLTTQAVNIANKVADIDSKINAIQSSLTQAIQRQQLIQGCP